MLEVILNDIPRENLMYLLSISAVLTIVILVVFYKVVMSGYFYNRKYPIASHLDSMAKEGTNPTAKEIEKSLSKVDFTSSKSAQLEQFKNNIASK